MALIGKKNPVFTDEVTRRKIDLHLSDINDKISEQDIQNVKTDVTATSDPKAAEEADRIFKAEQKIINNEDENNTNSIETTWNILK